MAGHGCTPSFCEIETKDTSSGGKNASWAKTPDMLAVRHEDTTCCHEILKHAKTSQTQSWVEPEPRKEDEEISLSFMLVTDPADV